MARLTGAATGAGTGMGMGLRGFWKLLVAPIEDTLEERRYRRAREAEVARRRSLPPPEPATIESAGAGVLVLCLPPSFLMDTAYQADRAVLERVAREGSDRLVVDMSRCERIDAPGLATLVRFERSTDEMRRVVVFGVHGAVGDIFRIAKLNDVLEVVEGRDEAMARCGGRTHSP